MEFTRARALWKEKPGFTLDRPSLNEYIFLHYLSPVEILINGTTVTAQRGACIIQSPGTHQHFHTFGELVHNWFHVSGDIAALLEHYGITPNTLYYPNADNIITNCVQAIEIEFCRKTDYSSELCRIKLEEILVHLARQSNICTDPIFLRLRASLLDRYAQDISIEEIAKSVALSPSRFYTLYKKHFGVSPRQDILAARIEHAKLLLAQGSYSVSEVAEMTGYSSPYHFIRQFKQHTGMTPGKTKNSNK